mmetsp:Transcript_16522/g.23311  ORF Transcript_16522/g.23311 Transcript_16522/m.23311 type:complete len:95 (-) Transcript_16522:103-387(-)
MTHKLRPSGITKRNNASTMGCKPSKPQSPESLRAANLRDMEKNKEKGKDAMGHDKGIPRVTPGTPEAALLMRHMNNSGRPMIGFEKAAVAFCGI